MKRQPAARATVLARIPYASTDDAVIELPTTRGEWLDLVRKDSPELRDLIKREKQKTISEMNAAFAITEIGSAVKKSVIAEFDAAGDLACYRTVGDFKQQGKLNPLSYVPSLTVTKDGKDAIGFQSAEDFWLDDLNRRRYARLVMAPPGSKEVLDERWDYNLWRGFAVEPAAGEWPLIERHLRDVICGGDEKLYEWLLNWCAALLQRPGEHGNIAPVLRSGQGTGKGIFVSRLLGKMFRPRQFAHLAKPQHLTSDFNSQLSNQVLVFADEAFWGDPGAANALKGLITEDTILINEKHLPIRVEPSCLHIIIASNANRPVAVERDDRRLAVFAVNEAVKNDPSYFKPLIAEIENGGRAAFLAAMLGRVIDEDALRTPPHTVAKGEMKQASIDPMLSWWQEVLTEATGEWVMKRTRVDVHREFADWFTKRRYSGAIPSIQQLGTFFKGHFTRGELDGWPRYTKVQNANAWRFPPLAECRKVFEVAAGFTPEWPVDQLELPLTAA